MRVTGLTARRDLVMLTARDFDRAASGTRQDRAALPTTPPTATTSSKRSSTVWSSPRLVPHSRTARRPAEVSTDGSHPVEDDPELDDRLKAAAQAERVAREVEELRTRVRGRSQSVARDFDRVLRVLENWGYVDGWSLTDAGKILAQTFHECDLLIVECLRQGLLDELDPAALAGLVSVFVYEHRSPRRRRRRGSRRRPCASAGSESPTISYERDRGGSRPDGAPPARSRRSSAIAYAWAAGEGFAEVVEARGVVRWRLRAHDETVDRRAAAAGARRAGARQRGAAPSRQPTSCSAGWSPRRVRSRSSTSSKTSRQPTSEVMTIRKGEAWGEPAVCPSDLRVVSTDRELRDWVIWHRDTRPTNS